MARLVANRHIVLLLCMILFLGVASAEERKGLFSITPMVGGIHFDSNVDIADGLVVGAAAGYNFTENLSAEFVVTATDLDNDYGRDQTGFTLRLDALYHFRPFGELVPYAAAGFGAMLFDPQIDGVDKKYVPNYGVGVKWYFLERAALRGDVRHVFIEDDSHGNIQYTMGVEFMFGKEKAAPAPPPPPPDSDGDGVIDSEDKCPDTPRGVKVNSDGCPPDSDGDGVLDYLDKCPNTPRGVKVDNNGCPLDTDGDGVYDYQDKCPNTPRGVKVDNNGCPLDTDGDGVYDYQDKCPNTPRGVKVDNNGCPLDTDGDGVLDYLDKCPDTPRDLKVDSTGCPILMKDKVSIRLDIQFDIDSAVIKSEYNDRLKQVADFLVKYPETTAEIDGHTDSTGAASYNQKLSQRRAESVRDYLIKNFNISPDRLTAKGFGEEQPVATNDTAEGRSQNRRIEAVFMAVKEYYERK